jgi:hypothetical protein
MKSKPDRKGELLMSSAARKRRQVNGEVLLSKAIAAGQEALMQR